MTTKKSLTIAIGSTAEESQQLKANLRDFAASAGFHGRYGGDISGVMSAIGSLSKARRDPIALAIKIFIQEVDSLG